MSYCSKKRANKFSYVPNYGQYVKKQENGRILSKSASLLSLIRDTTHNVKTVKEFKTLIKTDRLKLWGDRPHVKSSVQLGESFVLDGQRKRLCTNKRKFRLFDTIQNNFHTFVKNVVLVKSGEQITLGNGFTMIKPVGCYRVNDFVRVCESTKKVEKIQKITSIIRLNGPDMLLSISETIKSVGGNNTHLKTMEGQVLNLNRLNLAGYLPEPTSVMLSEIFTESHD
jgi:ribosomal protein S4E